MGLVTAGGESQLPIAGLTVAVAISLAGSNSATSAFVCTAIRGSVTAEWLKPLLLRCVNPAIVKLNSLVSFVGLNA